MKFRIVIAFIVLLLILLGLLYMWPFTKKSSVPKIVETKSFSCPGMSGFTFEYPVFEGWKPGKPSLKLPPDSTTNGIGVPDRCRIALGTLGNLGMTNSVEVSVYRSDTRGKDLLPGTVIEKNPQSIPYLPMEDGYKFFTDYSAGNTVGIEIFGVFNKSFSKDIFFQTVIGSFRLVKISQEQALKIANNDATKAKVDVSKYNVKADLFKKGWRVTYESKEVSLGGGGPEYVIDSQTGEIISKQYAR